MSYLFTEFEDKERITFLEREITRLQDMCRKNFAMIDLLKKENCKLTDVQEELRETTSDLAYSMAECPWWEEGSSRNAIKIFAAFTQKIQYVLGLPTFIDPVEQLEKNGIIDQGQVKRILERKNFRKFSKAPIFKCRKCKRIFTKENSFKTHSLIHKNKKILKCQVCFETFKYFPTFKQHFRQLHLTDSQDSSSSSFSSHFEDQLNFKLNKGLKVRRFIKCLNCDSSFLSNQSFKNHQKFCNRSTDINFKEKNIENNNCQKSPNTKKEEFKNYKINFKSNFLKDLMQQSKIEKETHSQSSDMALINSNKIISHLQEIGLTIIKRNSPPPFSS